MSNEEFPKLQGSQNFLIEENGNTVARIGALALSHLQGCHLRIEHAPTVSRCGLGLALVSVGLGVLSSINEEFMNEAVDLMTLVEETAERYRLKDLEDMPF